MRIRPILQILKNQIVLGQNPKILGLYPFWTFACALLRGKKKPNTPKKNQTQKNQQQTKKGMGWYVALHPMCHDILIKLHLSLLKPLSVWN